MRLIQTIVEKNFTVGYKGKEYYVSYVNSDGHTLCLLNRYHWEIYDDEGELNIFKTGILTEEIKNNRKIRNKIINFCIKNFNKYKPDYTKE